MPEEYSIKLRLRFPQNTIEHAVDLIKHAIKIQAETRSLKVVETICWMKQDYDTGLLIPYLDIQLETRYADLFNLTVGVMLSATSVIRSVHSLISTTIDLQSYIVEQMEFNCVEKNNV